MRLHDSLQTRGCSVTAIRQHVRDLMVEIHKITPDLAAYHVSQMTDEDIDFRLGMYERLGLIEAPWSDHLPAAEESPKTMYGNRVECRESKSQSQQRASTRLPRLATMTACSRRSALFPGAAERQKTEQIMPDSEVSNRVRSADRSEAKIRGRECGAL
jgi:hypothetical protein